MIFRHFLVNVNESNAFLVACEETREAILVDLGDLEPAIEDFVKEEQLRLKTIFITHDHYDHTGGVAEAVAKYGAEVFAARSSVGGCKARKVAHGDAVPVGKLLGRVLSTPGHTSDSLSLVLPGMVFTGDTLFSGSIGGTSSRAEEIRHIRDHIFTLPPEYEIHTGHGPSSTVAIERQHNPFFV